MCSLNYCFGFLTCVYLQANSWMLWLRNLRQSFSTQAFIANMWERVRRRGAHWKKEASSHGRYSSAFLMVAHLTYPSTSLKFLEVVAHRTHNPGDGLKRLFMHALHMFPGDVQDFLAQELQEVGFPTKRIALCTNIVSYGCVGRMYWWCGVWVWLVVRCLCVMSLTCQAVVVVSRSTHVSTYQLPSSMLCCQFCLADTVLPTLYKQACAINNDDNNGNDNHENDTDKHQQDNGRGQDVHGRCLYDVHEGCAFRNDQEPVCLVSFGGCLELEGGKCDDGR